MTASAAPPIAGATPRPAPLGRGHALAAFAIFLVLITVYQTLVLTAVTDDVIRKGIEADEYDMIWGDVAWGVAIIYSLFGAFWLTGRIGTRITLAWGLAFFVLGNFLCGAAVDLTGTGLRPVRGGHRQGPDDRHRPGDAVQAIRPQAARRHRLLRCLRLRDEAADAAGHGLHQRVGLLAVDLLGERARRPGRHSWPCCDTSSTTGRRSRCAIPIDWLAISMFTAWIVCLLVRVQMVSQVGRLDVGRVRRRRPASASSSPSCWSSGWARGSARTST